MKLRRVEQFACSRGHMHTNRTCDKLRTGLLTLASDLPKHLEWSGGNFLRSTQEGYAGALVASHLLHGISSMWLYQYMRLDVAIHPSSSQNGSAGDHARRLLEIVYAQKTHVRPALSAPIPNTFL